jgi:hypothetical protein
MSLDGSVGVLSEGSSLRRCKDHPGTLLVFAFPLLPVSGLSPVPAFPVVHLHLTFSGLVWRLALRGRQEPCPFTTRLRVLKLVGQLAMA